ARGRVALRRAGRLIPAAALFLAVAAGSGVWYFYNAHVLNEYLTGNDRRRIQADYERSFKKYELFPQPKVIAVDASVDIFPEKRSFTATGRFTLQNKTSAPISAIHLTDEHEAISNVRFDRPFHLVSQAPRNVYSIYELERPLAPGETLTLTFHVQHLTRGFRDGNELPEFAYNG